MEEDFSLAPPPPPLKMYMAQRSKEMCAAYCKESLEDRNNGLRAPLVLAPLAEKVPL